MSGNEEPVSPESARIPDFTLDMNEIRAVTSFTATAAESVLPYFDRCFPDDPRPRIAIDTALDFAAGAPRSKTQRVSAPASHRAGKGMAPPIAFHAAMSAGDAAASAYLHPLAHRVQVNHILRGPAHAARALELASGAPEDTSDLIERIASLATPTVAEVLRRYPNTIDGENRIAHLMHRLDVVLRHRPAPTAPGHGFESIDREKGNP